MQKSISHELLFTTVMAMERKAVRPQTCEVYECNEAEAYCAMRQAGESLKNGRGNLQCTDVSVHEQCMNINIDVSKNWGQPR